MTRKTKVKLASPESALIAKVRDKAEESKKSMNEAWRMLNRDHVLYFSVSDCLNMINNLLDFVSNESKKGDFFCTGKVDNGREVGKDET